MRRGMLRSALGIVDAIVLEFDDATRLDHWLPILAGLSEPTAADAGLAADATAALLRGFSMRDPGSAELTLWLDRAAQAECEPSHRPRQHDSLALARATALALRGDLAAVDLVLETLQRRSARLPPAQRAALALALAVQSLLAGAPVDALASLDAALVRARDDGAHGCKSWLHVVATIAALAGGQPDRAQASLRSFEAQGEQLRRGDRALAHYLRGWLAAVERDHVAALRECRTATALAAETGAPWLECLARTASAEMLAATGNRRAAQAQLRSAHAIAKRMQSPLLSFGVQLAEAAAAHQGCDECATREALTAAFGTASMHGLHDAPVWRSESLAELCVVALRENIESDFVRALARRRRLAPVVPPLRVPRWPWQFRIETLGGLRMQHDDSPIEFAGKGPGRPIELLKVLVALGGRNVRAAAIADALWPQADADFAHKSFTTALHRLRRILGHDEAVLLRDGRLSLNAEIVWVDTWAFMQALDDGEALLRAAEGAVVESGLRTVTEEALRLYRGPYLFDEADHPAYVACREQVRAQAAALAGPRGQALGRRRTRRRRDRRPAAIHRGRPALRAALPSAHGVPPASRRGHGGHRGLRAAADSAGNPSGNPAVRGRAGPLRRAARPLPHHATSAGLTDTRSALRAQRRPGGKRSSCSTAVQILSRPTFTAEGGGYSLRGRPDLGGAFSRMRIVIDSSAPPGPSTTVALMTMSSPSGSKVKNSASPPTCRRRISRAFGRSALAARFHSSLLSGRGAGALNVPYPSARDVSLTCIPSCAMTRSTASNTTSRSAL